MPTIRLVPLDPPDAPALPVSARLRSQLIYFASAGEGPDANDAVYRFTADEVARWADEGVFYLVSPLDSANVTEVELSEEQEEFVNWLHSHKVRRVRVDEA